MDRRSFLLAAVMLPIAAGTRINAEEKAYPIPATDGVQIDRDQDVIIARAQGKVFAFSLACPHQNTALRWDGGKSRFQCPKHKSIYTPEGVFVEGRATRGLDRFAVRRDGNSIVANLDSLFEQDKDADKWTKAFVTA
jgi:Rieske Fe-S protein